MPKDRLSHKVVGSDLCSLLPEAGAPAASALRDWPSAVCRFLRSGCHRLLFACILAISIVYPSVAFAQIAGVNNSTATPVEGAGHDYIKLLSETVNPANGSVSLRIQLPTAQSRGFTLPFSISYDSGSVHHLMADTVHIGSANWSPNTGTLMQGGWSYSAPGAGALLYSASEGTYPNNYLCNITTNYIFRDATGGLHSLYLGTSYSTNSGTTSDCKEYPVASGGDDQFAAVLPWNPQGQGPYSPPAAGLLTVYSADGTVYQFNSVAQGNGTSEDLSLPTYIEDRNGNKIVSTGSGFTDTNGRTLVNWTGFGPAGTTNTLTVSDASYQIAWKTVSASFHVSASSQWVGASDGASANGCMSPPDVSDTQTVVSSIGLPNGTAYTFSYGNDVTLHGAAPNPYGLLSEIDYPSGAWVQYSWTLSNMPNEVADYPGVANGNNCGSSYCPVPVADACLYQYQTPVVTSRTVSFGGSSPSLTQTFSYTTSWGSPATSWTQKTTTLKSYDQATGRTAQTNYTYWPITVPPQPYGSYGAPKSQIPVEHVVQYFDFGKTTSALKTVNKTWYDQYELAGEQTVYATGQTASTNYTYGPFAQVTEKDEYDFSGTLARVTQINYQPFSNTPGRIDDKPCQVVICSTPPSGATTKCSSATSNRVSETDYLYDGGTNVCSAMAAATTTTSEVSALIATTHDDSTSAPTFTASSTTPRGNVTKQTKWLSSTGSISTTYAYDKTGQVISVTDPCNTSSCSDMYGNSHTTKFDYTDAYTVLSGTGTSAKNISYTPPNGNTNAFVTTITNALNQTQTFTYDYNNSQLTSSKDPNGQATGQQTTYLYYDPLDRPRLVTFPDGGRTNYDYNDSSYNTTNNTPSVTVTKAISSSLSEINITATDGIGHVVRTILHSDPVGDDIVDSSYDGFGRLLTQSNPHRSTSSPTDGNTNYIYDGLGRTVLVGRQDGSQVQTTYDITGSSGICTTVTDEAGKQRKSCSDGLGRLAEVDEPAYGTMPGAPGTGSVTITGSEQSAQYTCGQNQTCTMYDTGTITITIGGSGYSYLYGQSDTASSVAAALAASMNAGSQVSASLSGTTIAITSQVGGTASNYSLSVSVSGWNTGFFSHASFGGSPSGSNLTGGTDTTGISLYTPNVTLYTYDTLDNLTCAVQKAQDTTPFSSCASASSTWRPRSFAYDWASRLTDATNPESGHIQYVYDANGNVSSKTSPAPNQTGSTTSTISYCYDPLNRILGKQYSSSVNCQAPNLLNIQYLYDAGTNGIGRRTSMNDASGTSAWTYDPMGRVATTAKTIYNSLLPGRGSSGLTSPVTTSYAYWLDGSLQTLQYPSQRVVYYRTNSAGRNDAAYKISAGQLLFYAQTNTFAPTGQPTEVLLGEADSCFNGALEELAYNPRLQLAHSLYTTNTDHPTALNAVGASCVNPTGDLMDRLYAFGQPNQNNGNISKVTNCLDTNRSQNFNYDSLNRISQAWTDGPNWGEQYNIDAWGNLTNINAYMHGNSEQLNAAPANSRNQLNSGATWDSAGNQLTDSDAWSMTHSFAYDAENRVSSTESATYVYDGDGNRVLKNVGGAGTVYWYGADGSVLGESDLNLNVNAEYIFFGGRRLARVDNPTSTDNPSRSSLKYYLTDHLGSTSMITDATFSTVLEDADYYPFGGEVYRDSSDSNHYKFTGKERDAETGNDYFGARYYSSTVGRWLSSDWAVKPISVPYAEFGDPQSLNLYGYVRNNPLSKADADGHVAVVDDATILFAAVVTYGALVTEYYLSQPTTQRNLHAASTAAVSAVHKAVHTLFSKKSPPGTTQQQTNQGGQNNPTGPAQPKSNPWQGTPGSTSTTTAPDGTPKQVREYGPDGYPKTDVDYGHDHGQGDPHAHDIGRPADGSPPTAADRAPGRPVQPSDPKPQPPPTPQPPAKPQP